MFALYPHRRNYPRRRIIPARHVDNFGMVTYCIGSARQKRAYFEDASGVVVLDNVEVLFCASENGRNYFAYGDMPFGTFTVEEYLRYRRALCATEFSLEPLRAFGIQPNKLIRRLTPVEMRCVAYLEKTWGKTDKAVVINLDGTRFSRRANALLKKLIAAIEGDAYVCITDARFMTHAENGYKTLTFGVPTAGEKPTFYAAKKLAHRIGAKRVSIM